MKWRNTILTSAVAVGLIGSATTVFAATQSSQSGTNNVKSSAPSQTGQGWHRHGGPSSGRMLEVAKILGVTQTTLQTDLQSGKSIAEVAKSKGISEATLIAKLKADLKTNLDQAVKNGKLTSSRETTMLSNFNSHAKQFVERTGGFAGPGGAWHGRRMGFGGRMADVTTVLGISATTLRSDLQSGESIAQIAQSKGMSEATLIAKLKADFKSNLDQAVKNGKLTSSRETTMLSNFNSHVKQFVEQKGCKGPRQAPVSPPQPGAQTNSQGNVKAGLQANSQA
ncbi:hypothetical protein [Alicyclobacillus sp. SO9]|uniref:hypothetical protein n=1 Tax=Alicyclobacillus sp. SO9 TaxID=2665646 RepID=UPI0018E884B1|nr:hypothetical protein [Alicyclobacillus sp. SO9]QQE79874.1 hypothetical protein GI364_05155 [Alicyclobacillus sp. SO9]